MSNHFRSLVLVTEKDGVVSDAEFLRRFQVLYPKPTKYPVTTFKDIDRALAEDPYTLFYQ